MPSISQNGAATRSVSRAAQRWAHLRSVSKSLGPDLRLALMTGDATTVARVEGRRLLAAGWVSHLLQRLVVRMWSEPDDAARREHVAATYTLRREALRSALARSGHRFPRQLRPERLDTGGARGCDGCRTPGLRLGSPRRGPVPHRQPARHPRHNLAARTGRRAPVRRRRRGSAHTAAIAAELNRKRWQSTSEIICTRIELARCHSGAWPRSMTRRDLRTRRRSSTT